MISITLDLHFSLRSSNLIYDVISLDSVPWTDTIDWSKIEFKVNEPLKECKYIEININGRRFGI